MGELLRKSIWSLLFFIILVGRVANLGYGQIKPVPKDLVPKPYQENRISQEFLELKNRSVNLTDYLPKGYDKEGESDYTKEIQRGINENKIVLLPDFPVLINDSGLTVNSNNIILFQPNSKLILQSTSKETYEILRIHGVSNVKIYNANIIGDANSHKGDSGEWGMGIAIRTSKNVVLYNPRITNCWGDGIYVGTLTEKRNGKARWVGPSENITVFNGFIDANRRNGLSLVSVKNCKVYNSLFSNTRGAFPKSGIDIEPLNFADQIEIKNVITYNNGQDGIVISLVDIVRSKIKNHGVNIFIDNHQDFNSNMGLRLNGYREYSKAQGYPKINGHIQISNSSWNNNPYGALVIKENQSLGPTVDFVKNKVLMHKSTNKIKGARIKELPTVKEGIKGNHSLNFR